MLAHAWRCAALGSRELGAACLQGVWLRSRVTGGDGDAAMCRRGVRVLVRAPGWPSVETQCLCISVLRHHSLFVRACDGEEAATSVAVGHGFVGAVQRTDRPKR